MSVFYEFDQRAIVRALAEAQGITSGLWRLAARFKLMAGTAKFPDMPGEPESYAPAIYGGLHMLALFASDKPGPLVFDVGALLAEPKRDYSRDLKTLPSATKKATPKKAVATKKVATAKKSVKRP